MRCGKVIKCTRKAVVRHTSSQMSKVKFLYTYNRHKLGRAPPSHESVDWRRPAQSHVKTHSLDPDGETASRAKPTSRFSPSCSSLPVESRRCEDIPRRAPLRRSRR